MFCVRTEPLSSRSLTFLAPVIQILRETDFSSFLRGCQQAWKKKAVTSSDGLFLFWSGTCFKLYLYVAPVLASLYPVNLHVRNFEKFRERFECWLFFGSE